jgi:hypothetical protein
VAAKKSIDTVKGDLERKLIQQASHLKNIMDELGTKIVDTKIEVEVDVKQLDSKVDSNVKRIDNRLAELDKEVGTLKEAIKENSDVILRRQGEYVEQMQLQANQVSVLDLELELKSDVETVDPLENRQIDLTDESQIVELSNPEETDVTLRRQGEQAERRLVEENKADNSDSDNVVTKENIQNVMMQALFHISPT